MTYPPTYPPQFPQQPAPAYPPQYAPPAASPAYAPPAPAYAPPPAAPPTYPGQPSYPPQYAPPAPAYAPPPAAPLPPGSLDTFYAQPSTGGGPSFKFIDQNRQPQIGKSYVGIVARPVTDADVRAQTNDGGQVQTYNDGRPKFVMIVPMLVQASPEFPDGQAGWWVKGQARDELARAMAEAGAPAGTPEAGAAIRVTLTGIRPIPQRHPAFTYRVEYTRPNGAPPAPPAPVEAYTAPPAAPYAPPAAPYAPPAAPPAAPAPYPAAPPAAPYAPPAAPPAAPYAPQPGGPVEQHNNPAAPQPAPANGFTPDQAALYAKLTGQQSGQPAG